MIFFYGKITINDQIITLIDSVEII